jgi:hypothetical protein
LKRLLSSDRLREKYRVNSQDFTRNRTLSFSFVAVLILRGHKLSLQNAINKFFGALGKVFSVPSGSAYSQARQKLQPELFIHLNQVVCQDFYRMYGADDEVLTWRGHRVLAYDGTYINLPNTEELREKYTIQRNQHEPECVQALAGVLYDVRNDIGLGAGFGPIQAEKNFLLNELWQQTRRGDLIVMDRNFADYTVIAYADKQKREVLVRCPAQSFGVVNDFWKSDEIERIVTLTVPGTPQTKKFVREHKLPQAVTVRLLKFTLSTGETEVLLTTLIDRRRYPRAEFEQVYHWRWSEETYLGRLKNIFEVERFSGFSEISIKQDFHGVIFLATLESILAKSPQSELTIKDIKRQTKTLAQVNRAVSYVALVDRAAQLLADPRSSPEKTLEELHHLFQTNPTRNKEGRKFERKKLKHSEKLRFHRYKKRLTA